MQAIDDWTLDEPTVAEEERELAARQLMVRTVAGQVAAAVPGAAVLVVARGPDVPTGLVTTTLEPHGREVDPAILADILAGADDDRVAIALARSVLGDGGNVEHIVARDRDGRVMGVIAARPLGRVPASWLRTVLARAASGLASWLAVDTTWPAQTLLEAIAEPALAHVHDIVLAANTALARMLGRDISDVLGMPVRRITQRLTALRTCSLIVGGQPRAAIIFEGQHPSPIETSVLAALDRVLAERYAVIRHTTRLSIESRDGAAVIAAARTVDELVALALLDITGAFTSATPANHVRVRLHREASWIVLELVATGSVAHHPGLEHLGTVICAARARSLGGKIHIDDSRADTRIVRVSLPVAP